MKVDRIIAAWKDEERLVELEVGERSALPANPAGALHDLTPEMMSEVGGGSTWACVTTSSWVCAVTASVTICDDVQNWINENIQSGGGGGSNPPILEMQNKGYCFTAETLVSTPGGQRPIAAMQAGDSVLAFDQESGSVRTAQVSGVDVHRGHFPLLDATSGGEGVQVTTGHRFHDRDGWRAVEHFHGRTRAMDAHQRSVPMRLELSSRSASQVYNLRVEGLESYFVGARNLLVRDH